LAGLCFTGYQLEIMMGVTLWHHYENVARRIEADAFKGIATLDDWQRVRPALKQAFLKSMGLASTAPHCDPALRDFGEFRGEGYRARKVAFQMLPDCWTSATIYYPDPLPPGRQPAVLHLCGHAGIGILYYQPRVAMLARRGYIAMIVDTIEQHDAGGDHHGTFSRNRYDWISMGYTAAGGELYNGMRALDVLAALPEVDAARIGVTGASGGGAQSFFLAVADERIRALATACGVTMPRASIEDRHLHGHCDCMYPINRFQRCTSEFAALMAPRAALFANASEDSLFSNSEYHTLVEQTRRIYRLYGCEDHCELFEYPGPHAVPAGAHAAINRWFDRHVAGETRPPPQLPPLDVDERAVTVFNGAAPESNKMRLVPEMLSPIGALPLPDGPEAWPALRDEALARLRQEVFQVLRETDDRLTCEPVGNWIEGNGQPPARRLIWRGHLAAMDLWIKALVKPTDEGKAIVAWCGPDETAGDLLSRLYSASGNTSVVVVEGRTGGWNAGSPCMTWDYLRGGALIGLTPTLILLQDMAQVLPFLRALPCLEGRKLVLYGKGDAGAACLYQAAFDETIAGVITEEQPGSHRDGAFLPGILRVLDLDEAAGLVGPRPVSLVNPRYRHRRNWAGRLYQRLGVPRRYTLTSNLSQAVEKVLG
jgi:dienelactone hydrolase